jgi:hypothetical protein
MKIVGTIIFFLYWSATFGQKQLDKFSISFSTFNHAERIFDGTTTYLLTETSIKVKKTYFGDTTSKTIYSKKIKNSQSLILTLSKIEIDTLKDYYFNYCIMITSGDEYFLDFRHNSKKKSISLHHYYLTQLEDIIQIINSNLPNKYRFQYLTKDEKQDCKL